jgi:hypothetical protein
MHNTFGGVGLLSSSTEATIARVNLFLQHWGMPSPIGQMLQTSMEALQLEIGCVGCPLQEPFHPMGALTTHCWLRSFWEVVDKYRLSLEIEYKEIPLPRENDVTITSIAISQGFSDDDLLSITRCRLKCCSVFLSDITRASGRYLDPTRGQPGVDYSHYFHPIISRVNSHQNRIGRYGKGFGGTIAMQMDLYLALWVNGCIRLINNGSGFIIPIKT